MKNTNLLFILIMFSFTTFAQKQIKIYTDENFETINDKSVAKYYRLLTYNKNNRSGMEKVYSMNGTLLSSGKYLSTNLKNLSDDKREGTWIWYNENGNKYRISNFKNGKEVGERTEFDEDGKIVRTVPIENNEPDYDNSIIYAYSTDSYSTFKGQISEDNRFTGEQTIYYYGGDTVVNFFNNSFLDFPGWSIVTPFQRDKSKFALFYDDFKDNETSKNYIYNSDEKVKVEFSNEKLHISFNSLSNRNRSINLPEAPISLNDNDFLITVDILKESDAFIQGIEFGKIDADNLHRVHLINNNNKKGILVYENVVDGNFVEGKSIEDITYWNRQNDNTLSVKKRGNTISISVNGNVVYEIYNAFLNGDVISLIAGATDNHTQAYFKNFKTKIEIVKNKKSQITVKKREGVYLVPVELNSVLKIDFIFDSGASDVSISPDIALTLIKAGTIKENDWLQGAYYKFADGSIAKSKRFKLRNLKIGDKVINNVTCSISNSIDAPMLLGQSVLSKFGKYTFDNVNQKLIIE